MEFPNWAKIPFHKASAFEKEDTYNLRGLCMMAIIVHHLFQFSVVKYGVSFSAGIWKMLQASGYLATSVFFLLSGYGLYCSLDKQKKITAEYALMHFFKLLLPFVFVWIVSAVCTLAIKGASLRDVAEALWAFKLPMGGRVWFFNEIIILYALTYLMFALIKDRRASLVAITLCVLAWIAGCMGHLKWGTQWYNSVLCFPVGLWISHCRIKHKMLGVKAVWVRHLLEVLLLALFVALYIVQGKHPSLYFPKGYETVGRGLTMIGCGLSFALLAVIIVKRLNIRCVPLRYYGRHSLIFYIGQMFLLSLYIVAPLPVYCALVVGGTLLLALIYVPIERQLVKGLALVLEKGANP